MKCNNLGTIIGPSPATPVRTSDKDGVMADDLNTRIADFLKTREWYELPRVFAMLRLVEIRNELRAKNLIDTEEPPFELKLTV